MAGQSVPHVHVHVIPRHPTDYDGDNDRIYPALESHEKELRSHFDAGAKSSEWTVPKDEDRQPRSMEQMASEADWMRGLFPPSPYDAVSPSPLLRTARS